MNILFAMPWDLAEGGVIHVANSLARTLEERGHQAFFFFPGSNWRARTFTSRGGFRAIACRLREYPEPGDRARVQLAWHSMKFSTRPQLARFCREQHIDAINVHYLGSGFAALGDLAKRLNIPLVLSAHGSDLLPDEGPLVSKGIDYLLAAAGKVIVPSRTFLGSVVDAYPAIREKADFIYNGYDRHEFEDAAAPREQLRGGLTALCIAAHIHKKGLDVLLRAMAAMRDRSLRLRLVGDGTQRPRYEALAQSLGLADRVTFVGSLNRRDVVQELKRCDLLVLPSRNVSESFGLAVLEAMVCGKPVVASKIGGLGEVVDPDVSGLLVPPDDVATLATALDRLCADAALRQRLGEGGRERARQFTVEQTADQYEALFARLIGQAPGRRPPAISAPGVVVPARDVVAPARDASSRTDALVRGLVLGLGLLPACARSEGAPHNSAAADTTQPRYETRFATTEAPISEGGQWINGAALGGDWTDVSTDSGRAIGHQVGASYTDATALLTGSWNPDQGASATVFATGPRPDKCKSEVELRLRSRLAPHENRGYEVTFSVSDSNPYLLIARWNGPLGDFTVLGNPYGRQYQAVNGDVVRATMVGNRITAWKNGIELAHVTDDRFTDGNPGIGFNLENSKAGCPGTNGAYGFSKFSATELGRR